MSEEMSEPPEPSIDIPNSKMRMLPPMAPESQYSRIERRSEGPRASVSSSDIRRALRDRQKARNRISCLPCRERKVRCNREHPCLTCIKRDHPDLCIYSAALLPARPGHGRPAAAVSPASPASTVFSQAELPDRQSPSADAQQRPRDGAQTQSGHASPSSSSGMPLLGGSSLLAIAREHNSQTYGVNDDAGRGDVLENAVMPLLGVAGMEHSSRLGTPSLSEDLYADLPRDRELLTLFAIYRTRVHPFQRILGDMDAVESELCAIISERAVSNRRHSADAEASRQEPAVPNRRRFLCLLHAILATGGQFSDLTVGDRSTISRRHGESTTRPFVPRLLTRRRLR